MVDTEGFNDRSWLDDVGHPHTEALHTTERFERRDFGHLDITVRDPNVYSKPWTVPMHFVLQPDTELIEDVCDIERDHLHAVGQ